MRLLSAALAGACVGFLVHNFHPARVFMGDSGSMLIGLVLSATAITVTTQFSDVDIDDGGDGARASLLPMLLPVALPILILIVPLADLVLAVVRRTAAGRSPFAPDKQHLHHRLLEIGHSHRRAVVIMWLWAGLVGFGTVFVSLFDDVGSGSASAPPSGHRGPHLPGAVSCRARATCHRRGERGRSDPDSRASTDFVITFTSAQAPLREPLTTSDRRQE